eukprot:scaffold5755_cov57-Phaeocystis_antarctica.AAC.2
MADAQAPSTAVGDLFYTPAIQPKWRCRCIFTLRLSRLARRSVERSQRNWYSNSPTLRRARQRVRPLQLCTRPAGRKNTATR